MRISVSGAAVVFASCIGMTLVAYQYGQMIQVEHMKRWSMSEFCASGYNMACELHPDCIGKSLMCMPHPDLFIERLQQELEEGV